MHIFYEQTRELSKNEKKSDISNLCYLGSNKPKTILAADSL